MSRFYFAMVIVGLFSGRLSAQENKDFFGLTRMHEFHLELSATEWTRMQKVSGGPGLFATKKPIAKEGEEPFEWHKSPGFGLEFPWAHADLTTAGKTFKNVGVRYKGNGSYMGSVNFLKRNLKIEIDHYQKDQRWLGLRTITLNAGTVDASRLREALAYSVFSAAGVPAPRTAFARVTLTVPGKYDKEFLGVYTFIEHVDKAFLGTHFKDDTGLLMKPEGQRGIDYPGDEWAKYQRRLFPKREATKDEAARIIAFAKLTHQADDAKFAREISSYLDINNFLRFVAVNAMLPNTDSMLTTGHNYFVYLNGKTNKLAFMPWDLDIAFAGFPMMGSVAQQTNQDLLKPVPGKLRIVDRLLAIPEVNAQYRNVITEIATKTFTKEKLLGDIDNMRKALQEPLALERKAAEARKEKPDGFGAFVTGFFDPQPELRGFVERRADVVEKQVKSLNGSKSK